jgi:outer membrane protein insertion porin family
MIHFGGKKTKQFLVLIAIAIGFVLPVSGRMHYTIRSIHVSGNTVLDRDRIIALTGLQEGSVIDFQSKVIQKAIRKIYKEGSMQSVAIYLSDRDDEAGLASLMIQVEGYPQCANYVIEGLSKREQKALLESVTIPDHAVLSPFFLQQKREEIKNFFLKKGFAKVSVDLTLLPIEASPQKRNLKIVVNKGRKNTVATIRFKGNDHFDARLLIHSMKEMKPAPHFTLVKDMIKQIVTLRPIRKSGLLLQLPKVADVMRYVTSHVSLFSSVFSASKYAKAKENLVAFYQSNGFLDMRIVEEQIQYAHDDTGKLHLQLTIEEGEPYTIRHINWIGAHLYDEQTLNKWLNLPPGRIYDPLYINKRLSPAATATDLTIADLYTNNGYVFFRAEVIETGIEDHQVDLEIRLVEGKQATISEVNIVGNTLTHEGVIRRELTTLPGAKYNRRRILESLQNLAMLDFFNPAKLIPEIHPNEEEGTIDLTYHVEEQPKFDCKLNGTYNRGVVVEMVMGSKNVSVKNLFKGKIPFGAAQHLHLTASLRGKNYKNLSLTFQEPWLWIGGKRYIFSLHASSSYQVFQSTNWMSLDQAINVVLFPFAELTHNNSTIYTTGGRMALGKKLSKHWEGHFGLDYHYHYYRHTVGHLGK